MADGTSGLTTYNATVIQDAIDETAGTGLPAYIGPGIYEATATVNLLSDVTLIFDPGAILSKGFSGGATLGQQDPQTKITNVKLIGGRIDNPQQLPGSQISIFGDHVSISGMEIIDFYSPGLGVYIVGNDNKLSDLRVVTSCLLTGAGGIRMAGGNNFQCSNCYVSSGDDALQFVPGSPNVGSADEDVSINDSQYVNCVGISAVARACVVFLENRSSTNPMTANITNCAFIGIRGRGGSIGALCANKGQDGQPAAGAISSIQFIGVSLSQNAQSTDPIFAVEQGGEGDGPIQQIDFIGCTAFDGAGGPGLFVQNAARVRWIGGSLAAGKTSPTAVEFLQSTDCDLRDATVVCSPASTTGIKVGFGNGSTGPSDRIRISGVTVMGIPGNGTGIVLDRTQSCVVAFNTCLRASNAQPTYGISATGAPNCLIDQNNLLSVDYPYVLVGSGYIDSTLGVATSASGTVRLSSGTADVTFPVVFMDGGYSVQLTGNTTSETFAFSNRSALGFTIISSNSSSTAEVCWSALHTQF